MSKRVRPDESSSRRHDFLGPDAVFGAGELYRVMVKEPDCTYDYRASASEYCELFSLTKNGIEDLGMEEMQDVWIRLLKHELGQVRRSAEGTGRVTPASVRVKTVLDGQQLALTFTKNKPPEMPPSPMTPRAPASELAQHVVRSVGPALPTKVTEGLAPHRQGSLPPINLATELK